MYENNIFLRKKIDEFLNNYFSDKKYVYFANGSFGDHVVFAAMISNCSEKKTIGLICPLEYINFYKTFYTEEIKIIGVDNIQIFERYIISFNDWLFDRDYKFIPLLPVYYPLIGNLIDDERVITHIDIARYLLKLGKNATFQPQKEIQVDFENLKYFKLKKLEANQPYIIISPQSNTLIGLGQAFWSNVVYKISKINKQQIFVNAPENYINLMNLNDSIITGHIQPEYIFKMVEKSAVSIMAPSGLSHLSKYYSYNSNIHIVSDWRLGDKVKTSFGSFTESINQEQLYSEDEVPSISNLKISRFTSNDTEENFINKLIKNINN